MNTTTHDYARALDRERHRSAAERHRLAEARSVSAPRVAVTVAELVRSRPVRLPAAGRDPCA